MKTTLDVGASLGAIIWPIVVLILLLLYREPLGSFLSGLSGRLTKFSAFDFSIELSTLSSPAPWTDPSITERSEISGGDVSNTSGKTLFDQISADRSWDYLTVDVKDGKFWFVSRLFIFTVFLQAMKGLKCVVFVQSTGEYRYKLLGISSPHAVRIALVQAFPWMERALANALNRKIFLDPALPLSIASHIIQAFIADKEMRLHCDPQEVIKPTNNCNISKDQLPTDSIKPDEWIPRGNMKSWEHTQWLTIDLINALFGKSFFEWDSSHYEVLPGNPTEKWSKELLYRSSPFVALVNSRNEFQSLVDRQKLADHIVKKLLEQ